MNTSSNRALDSIAKHNQSVWDRQATENCRWSTPVSEQEIADARAGRPHIILTPDTPVPLEWLGELKGRDVLCLSSGGGQQAPLLAAAGAIVTSYDLSDKQLALDQSVAKREGLELKTIQGDMRDLGAIKDASFDLIVHVCSNAFVPDIIPVWNECHRVLRSGGELLSGFLNPDSFIFDHEAIDRGEPLLAVNKLPYSDVDSVSPEHYQNKIDTHDLLEFSHSMSDQIGGQIVAGFHIVGFFEDSWEECQPLNEFFPLLFATRARKV